MGRFGGEERAGGAERGEEEEEEEEECREGRGDGAGFGQGFAAAGGDVQELREAFLEEGGPFLEQGEQGGRPFEQRQEAGELTPNEAALISSEHLSVCSFLVMLRESTRLVAPPVYRGVPAPVSPSNVDCNRTLLELFQVLVNGTPFLTVGQVAANSAILEALAVEPRVLVNATPFLTFGQVAANSAILEALADEPRVHIIDFGIGHALQWPALLQALGARPGGPPHVRVTGIEVPQCGAMSPYCAMKAGKRLEVSVVYGGGVASPPAAHMPGGPPHVRVTGIEVLQCGAMSPYCAMKAGKRLEVRRKESIVLNEACPTHIASVARRIRAAQCPLPRLLSPFPFPLFPPSPHQSAAAMWGVPLRYHWVMSRLEDVTPSMLNLHPGEAIAANCALRLSQLLDESEQPNSAANPATAANAVFANPPSEPLSEPLSGPLLSRPDAGRTDVGGADPDRLYLGKADSMSSDSEESPRMRVLRTIRMLRPKVVTVVEQYSNHSSPFFLARFYEALYYYAALFESIDASLPRNEVARRVFEEQVRFECLCVCPSVCAGHGRLKAGLLRPKVVTVVEQYSNHSSPFFLARFYEALYAALFESIDASLPRNEVARRVFEEQVLGRAIVNLVACEGQERVERQEPLEQWQQRMLRAGFKPRGVGAIGAVAAEDAQGGVQAPGIQ
ncbi:unnamed protein product [Closterium sp. Naga37s-1]|nr:unnamed protein product [Closterium sp. Naga37s-1]